MPQLEPIGRVVSPLTDRHTAPKQGIEGAPEAWIEILPKFRDAARDLRVGNAVLVLTWLHESDRSVQVVHPRSDPNAAQRGVFSTRSPDRPNPIGIHRVTIMAVDEGGLRFRVRDLEAIDGTPVIDIKPVLDRKVER